MKGSEVADNEWARLVPELICSNFEASLAFYCDRLGFEVRFVRPEDGFAYIQLGGAQLMLAQQDDGSWSTGLLEQPYGRGINLQIETDDAGALRNRLIAGGTTLFRDLSAAWYRDGEVEHGQREFLVQDPDGYLLRFFDYLGERTANAMQESP